MNKTSGIPRWRAGDNFLGFQVRYVLWSQSQDFLEDEVGVLTGMGGAGQVGGFQVAGFDYRAGHPDRAEVRIVNVMEAGQGPGVLFRFKRCPDTARPPARPGAGS